MKDVFIDREYFQELLERLKSTKSIVLQGPPGTGKSFLGRRVAEAYLSEKNSDRIQTVQFHASYAYEDFIQGYRPDGKGGFERKDGVFMRFCRRASEDIGRPHVLIIDEINRANLSKVFGELLMLIEKDKGNPEFAVELAYSTEEDQRLYVPGNLHIIGLMNTADRSLALVDYALRRRFDFCDIEPGFETSQFAAYLGSRGVPEPLIAHIRSAFGNLNQSITQDRDLGRGCMIGHSYFCDLPAEDDAEDAYNQVIEYQIAPFLREYWYEGSKAEGWRQQLLWK